MTTPAHKELILTEEESTHALGRRFAKTELYGNNTIISACANYISITNVVDGSEEFFDTPNVDMSAFAVCPEKSCVAVSGRGLEPTLSIYGEDGTNICDIQGGSELDYHLLAFNVDGSMLLSVSSEPQNSLIIWESVAKGAGKWAAEPVVETEVNLTCMDSVKSSPVAPTVFISVGAGIACHWNVERLYKGHHLNKKEIKFEDKRVTCHAWSPSGICMLGCDNGDLVCVDEGGNIIQEKSMQLEEEGSAKKEVQAVAIADEIDIAGVFYEDGSIVLYSFSSADMIGGKITETSYECSGYRKAFFNVKPDKIIVQTRDEQTLCLDSTYFHGHEAAVVDETSVSGLKLSVMEDFHIGPITGMAALRESGCVVTCGEDGTMRRYNVQSKIPTSKLVLGTSQTALAQCGQGLFVTGSSKGVLRVIDSSTDESLTALWRKRIHDKPVRFLAYSEHYDCIASCDDSGCIFIIKNRGGSPQVLGYFTVDVSNGPVVALGWSDVSSMQGLIVFMRDGHVQYVAIPTNLSASASSLSLDSLIQISQLDLGVPISSAALLPSSDVSAVVVCDGAEIRMYSLDNGEPWEVDTPRKPKYTAVGHEKPGGSIAVSACGKLVVTGGGDGSIIVLTVSEKGLVTAGDIFAHSTEYGISNICLSDDYKQLYTSDATGTLMCFNLRDLSISPPEPQELKVLVKKPLEEDVAETEEELTVIQESINEEKKKREVANIPWRTSMLNRLGACTAKLNSLLEENDRSHPREKLDREEFVVDKELHAMRIKAADAEASKLGSSIVKQNHINQIIRERIKKTCWDSMETHAVSVLSFDSETKVDSYPLVKDTADYLKKLRHVQFLRKVEQEEFAYYKSINVEYSMVPELVESLEEDAEDDPRKVSAVENSKADDGGLEEDEIPAGQELQMESAASISDSLLYSPYELNTVQRRISQQYLLGREVRRRQRQFNELVMSMKDRKAGEIDKIKDMNQRLREIVKELLTMAGPNEELEQMGMAIEDPLIADVEVSERILEVTDAEVSVPKYISPEQQAKMDAEREEEQARMAARSGDDPAERALKMMMGGSLERGRDNDAEEDLVRPEWMNQPRDKLSEEELKLVKDFEAKEKLFLEEKEKQKKALETEFKKLNADVAELRSRFDDALSSLFQNKLSTEGICHELELQIIRLNISVEQSIEEYERKDNLLSDELDDLKKTKAKSSSTLTEFKRELDDVREQHDQLILEAHSMDRGVKKELSEAGAPNVDVLYKLYKRRQKNEEGEEFDLMNEEVPEGVMPSVWQLLVEKRADKLAMEATVKKHSLKIADMQKYMQKLHDEDDRLRDRIEAVLRELKHVRDLSVRNLLNLDIPLNLKQGLVEIDFSNIHVDMNDAVLIDRKVVEEVNETIKKHGEAKTDVLVAIKDFKKGIYELQWENKKLEMQSQDLVEKTKELQLLRVTKNLKFFLKNGEDTTNQSELTALEARLDHNKMLHEKHLNERRKQIQKLRSLVDEKHHQNDILFKQIREMEMSVADQERLREQNQGRSAGSKASRRIRSLMTERKLQDIAKAQQEEIAELHRELERLRRRTYPSFVDHSLHAKRGGMMS